MSSSNAEPLPIVYYPDPGLNKSCRALTKDEIKSLRVDKLDLKELVDRMIVTMYKAKGIGLAAPQIGVELRLFIIDISPDHDDPYVFINPVLSEMEGSESDEEGCLSIPDVRANVKRSTELVITGFNLEGEEVTFEADDLLARVCQHEYDHLDGILFIQHIGTAARFMVRKKLRALEEDYEFNKQRRARRK